MTRARRWVPRTLAVLFGLALGLGLAEAALRLAGLAPEVAEISRGRFRLSANPEIGYEPIPGFEHQGGDLRFHAYRGRANALGFRDHDHPRTKPAGQRRVLVLGDSIAEGMRVHDTEEVFPARLETHLRARGFEAEVLNFGVSGYNTLQEVASLEDKGLAFSPDLVLVAYCHNDDHRADGRIMDSLLNREDRTEAVPAHRTPAWVRASGLFRFLRYRIFPAGSDDPEDARERRYRRLSDDTRAEAFARLARLGNREGFEVLVAIFPLLDRLDAYPHLDRHREVLGLLEPVGLPALDLLAAMRRCTEENPWPEVARDRFHPGRAGHDCAAEAMAAAIAERWGPPAGSG